MQIDTIPPHSAKAWLIATRPKTFGVAIAPVLSARSVTLSDTGRVNVLVAFLTILLAILMQAITNMENDAGYTKRKAERDNRKGLPRATSLGLLSVQEVEWGIRFLAIFALLITIYFIYITQWIFLLITLCSVAAAYMYMGGPKPIAYTPYGEIAVFIFFGLVATCGTYYLQLHTVSNNVTIVACAIGLIASAVLCVNNFRDIEHDESIQRYTMAVVLGRKWTVVAYKCMIFIPFLLILILVVNSPDRYPYLFVLASLPMAISLPKRLIELKGNALNQILFATVKLELAFTLSLSIGALIHAYLTWFH